VLGYMQYTNDFHNDSKCRKKPTQCTCYKNTTKLHVSVAELEAAIILHYTGPTYMPNQRINTPQKETHSKILPSPTYMEITKNSIALSRSKGLRVCGTLRLSVLGYREYLTVHNCGFEPVNSDEWRRLKDIFCSSVALLTFH